MAAIGSTFYNLVDLYKEQNPDGSLATVIEMLMEHNPMLEDAVAVECNNGTDHVHTIRTGLPDVTWGKLYKGIPQSKSRKAQVKDTTGFVEGLSTVDTRILEMSTDRGAVRLSEANSYLESMEQEVASKLIYGNTASDPEQFLGLAPRFNDFSAPNGGQIIDAAINSPTPDNTSIWFIGWGEGRTQLLYPKGTQAGVKRDDKGQQRVTDGNNDAYYVEEELFTHHVGLAVADWRYITRVANIDVATMIADPSNIDGNGTSLFDVLRKAYWKTQSRRPQKLQTGSMGRFAIYCNSDVLQGLDALSTNSGGTDNFARLKPIELEGKEVLSYRGMPLRETDALLNTESVVL